MVKSNPLAHDLSRSKKKRAVWHWSIQQTREKKKVTTTKMSTSASASMSTKVAISAVCVAFIALVVGSVSLGMTSAHAQGQQGKEGPTGPTGPSGVLGFSGATGVVGVSGVSGATGGSGPTGVVGPTGLIGATGSTGPLAPALEPLVSFGGAGTAVNQLFLYNGTSSSALGTLNTNPFAYFFSPFTVSVNVSAISWITTSGTSATTVQIIRGTVPANISFSKDVTLTASFGKLVLSPPFFVPAGEILSLILLSGPVPGNSLFTLYLT